MLWIHKLARNNVELFAVDYKSHDNTSGDILTRMTRRNKLSIFSWDIPSR